MPVLVLWDLDMTLLTPAGFGARIIPRLFEKHFGVPPTHRVLFAGRTDRAILEDLLSVHGIDATEDEVRNFQREVCADSERARASFTAAGGGALPGAHAAVAALAEVTAPAVYQGVLTGNMRRTGVLKLVESGFRFGSPEEHGAKSIPAEARPDNVDAFDRTDAPAGLLDPRFSAFGDDTTNRSSLVDICRRGLRDCDVTLRDPRHTVLIGDTPLDIDAAHARGAAAVAVATGHYAANELSAADAVLPGLRDPVAVVAAVLAAAGYTTGSPR